MYDPSPQRGPANATEWWISAAFLAILIGLFAAEIYSDYTPAKLSALLFLVFYVPLLVLHECGHAVAAYVLGWRVAQNFSLRADFEYFGGVVHSVGGFLAEYDYPTVSVAAQFHF